MGAEKGVDEILGVNKKWLPPSPHREKILEAIQEGKAIIQERGHNIPPLLLVEDGAGGGALELPKVRFTGSEKTGTGVRLVAAGDTSQADQTKHPDVCATIDELKRLLKDKPELAQSEPQILFQLLEDACYMIERMQTRREAYERFVAEVASLCQQTVEGPDPAQADKAADELRASIRGNPEHVTANLERLYELAEVVRGVASNEEGCLSRNKERAINIGILYKDIKGARNWTEGEE